MEDDKLGSSVKTIETDGGYSIVLELFKNDPLFDKKKKLLNDKGLGIKEQINLKCSLTPDSLTTTYEKMLQMARILHLDEVELYFSEDVCSSKEIYSPKNEVEALNSILLKVDMLLSSMHKQMDILKVFRDSVIDRIHELGVDKMESRVDKSLSCENEKCLLHWGESNGVRTRLQIAGIEGYGRGALAIEDLNVGDIALEIPVSIIISEECVYQSDMYQILEKIDGISSETMMLLWSMREKRNTNSKFKTYFDTLPEAFNTGLSFGVDAIMALDGTLMLEEIMQAKEHLRLQYDEIFPALCNDHPDIFPPELYTWECFLWACELWYSNSMKVMFADGKLRTCLIPIGGFLNHSLDPHIVHYGKVDSATNSLKFPLSRPCHKGEQCYLSYGNLSSSHLITFYGFMPQGDNPYDVIPLDININEAESDEGCPVTNWTTHMVRGTWMSNNHDIFCYGLPSPLLNCFRRARSPVLHNNNLVQENLEIEKEVLEDIQYTFSDMMENLGDMDFIDRENTSWDVKLALEFKDLQKRILSSILTSCSAGLKLIENKLSK
ncbi:uncharacterized protein LOC110811109 [Carica papaya]|uniref:uncharacterized protein LOC110811109 n=1 Tax=Carica papaya TaxID=3649 RepID=UPI000B8C874F|nr:uncharacterized protein LOC110811109 [Carica papaya]